MLDQDDGRSAARLIAVNPTLRSEVEVLLPLLEGASRPATEPEILEILVRHAAHYGITQKMAGEWGAFFAAYLDTLDGISAHAIEDGFLRWNRGEGHKDIRMAGFYPKAPQLFLLARVGAEVLAKAVYRSKMALGLTKIRDVEQPRPRITEEERKKIAEDFRALAKNLGVTGAPKPPDAFSPRPSPQQMAEKLRAHADEVGDVI